MTSFEPMTAIYLMAFTIVILFGKLLKKIFFGTLRAAESEHLIERFFYAVTETCLAFTVFRDDFSPKFVALFTVLLFLKAFHWLADYRVDYMERSPVITRIFHIRVATLLILLSTIDILLIRHAYHSTMSLGASVQLVFGFEYAILLTVAYNIGVKYICHGIELQSENTWENKAMYLLYTELFVGLVKVLLYLAFLFIMVRIHTFPLFIIRPMYLTMKSFKRALQDILHSRRAIHAMNTQYPNATEEDLRTSDTVCIICRDEMLLNTDVKKLPCNHLFHANCLRSWFQRQQTCPTCRLDILRDTPPRNTQAAPNAPAAAANNNNQGQPPQPAARRPMHLMDFMQQMMDQVQARNNNNQQNNNAAPAANNQPQANTNANPANLFPFVPPQLLQVIRQNAGNNTAPQTGTNAPGSAPAGFTIPPFPPMPGAFPPMAGAFPPIPPLPRDFGPLTDQELKAMEGRQREHIIKRLQMLQNVTTLINASIIQLQQYNTLMANLDTNMPVPQTSTPEAGTSKSDSKPFKNTADSSSSTSSSQQKDESAAASDSNSQPDQQPSSADANPDSSSSSNGVTSTSPGDGPSSGDNAEEVRRRRLEHFVASSH